MKFASVIILLSIFLCLYCPSVSGKTDDLLLINIMKVTLEIPLTGTALQGTKDYLTGFRNWLVPIRKEPGRQFSACFHRAYKSIFFSGQPITDTMPCYIIAQGDVK
ncbi:hypothetical protein [Methanoregula sp.]|uniref:hypothetical protein n=2 Tax=Methanoregula sp. TaxID=2052170 RepID=UPI003BAE53A4